MDLLTKTIQAIGELDKTAMVAAQEHQQQLVKPPGSLGVLEDLAVHLAGITGQVCPDTREKVIITMAGDHGVVEEGTSAWPSEVTQQMMQLFIQGGAAINVLARQVGAKVVVVDLGTKGEAHSEAIVNHRIRPGTGNMTQGPAMEPDQAVAAVEIGIQVVKQQIAQGAKVIGTGDMGIGNTTASSAILAALSGYPVEHIVGRGAGLNNQVWAKKVASIKKALRVNQPDPRNGLEVLSRVGGLEIGGIAGCILGAAAQRIPVVIDGFISGAGALIAAQIQPQVRQFMLASHLSAEPGHRVMLEWLGLKPLLQMELCLGEGTGAALVMPLLDAAQGIMREMATFTAAQVIKVAVE